MAFKLSKEQLTERDALVASLREKAEALNVAIAAFDRVVEPASEAVREALDDYNGVLERARTLASSIAETLRKHSMRNLRNGRRATKASWCEGGSSNGK
jgi:hypothetical protein